MSRFTVRRTLLAVLAASAACAAMPAFASKDKPVIGFSIADLQEERWAKDRDFFIASAKTLGAEVIVQNADGDIAKQTSQVENLISKKVDAIVIVPKDASTLTNACKEAHKAGIKIVAYDRLIKSPDVDMYISFDNERVGKMQGDALMAALPKGNIYVMSGDPGDNNAKMFKAGAMSAIKPFVDKGAIKILGEQAVQGWKPENALKIAENVLTQFNNKIDGFLAPNDGTAGGIIQALAGQKMDGKVPVTGQDADVAAIRRIIAGTQLMTVYKSLNVIGTESAKITVALIKGQKPAQKVVKVEGVDSVLLDPIAITKANIQILLDDKHVTKEQIGM
jgi:D-xylose transport system substrate-binding protein